eukprot:2837982-Rhodomonas_salina.1
MAVTLTTMAGSPFTMADSALTMAGSQLTMAGSRLQGRDRHILCTPSPPDPRPSLGHGPRP